MMLPRHPMTSDMLSALARGDRSVDVVNRLSESQLSKHMILLNGVLITARDTGHKEYPAAKTAFDLLAAAVHADPGAARCVIRHPSVGAWARRTVLACRERRTPPGAGPTWLAGIAAAAAVRCGLTATVEVPTVAGSVTLPTLGAAVATGESAVVRTTSTHTAGMHTTVGPVEVPDDPHTDAPGWMGLRRVRHNGFDIVIDDLDPFRMPSVTGLPHRTVTSHPETWYAWVTTLQGAFDLLEARHGTVADEVAATVATVIPQSEEAGNSVSTTSLETFGAIAMSLPTDSVLCAETLTHELQHLKLGAVLDHLPLTETPDDGRRYYAPWRNDPRPASGLLQGCYAYLGITRFWRRQRGAAGDHAQAEVSYAQWREATAMVARTLLASGRLTTDGTDFVGGIVRTLDPWLSERVPDGAVTQAKRLADAHRARWESAHGPVPQEQPI